MKNLQLTKPPVVKAGMLIRKPVVEVFEAFISPEITTKFWFTKSSGRLESGKQVTWTWEIYNVFTQVNVKEIVENRRILIEWGDPGEMTEVEWTFISYDNDSTFVKITNSGFRGDGDSVVAQALDSTGGFTTVLDGAKAWLEHGIELNLIEDKFPKGLTEH
jgi:uncharacterized protein YndB with AHSA1/START domain